MTAVLGDFLRPARAHITAAAGYGGDLPVPAKRGVIAELDRLVATMSRYLDDVALPADFTPASTANPDVRAALDARLALRRAASSLHPAATAVQDAMADNAHPAAGHLSSANGYLAAGRDLLQTHFTTGPAGEPVGNSWWATVITSPPVTAALLAELAAYSRQLAAWTAQLSRTGSPYAGLPADASQGLRTASRWLRMAGNSVQAARLQQIPRSGRTEAAGCNTAGYPAAPAATRQHRTSRRTMHGHHGHRRTAPPRSPGFCRPGPLVPRRQLAVVAARRAGLGHHQPRQRTHPPRRSPNAPRQLDCRARRASASWPARPTPSARHGQPGKPSHATGTPSAPASTMSGTSPRSLLNSGTSCCGPDGWPTKSALDACSRGHQPDPRPGGPRRHGQRHQDRARSRAPRYRRHQPHRGLRQGSRPRGC